MKGVLDAIRFINGSFNRTKENGNEENLKQDLPSWPPVAAEFVLIEPRIASDLVNAIDHELEGGDCR